MIGSLWEYFLFHGLAEFFFSIVRLECLCHLVQELSASSPGVWHETPFTATSVPKLISFIPISTDEKWCYFRFRILANHLASFFFLPLSGDSLGLLSLSPGHKVQTSVGFHSDLDLLLRPWGIDQDSHSSFNGQSFGGLLIQTRRGRGHSLFFSSQW